MKHNISFHKSIGTKLLRFAFSLYMIVTLLITSYHLVSEYFHAEESVVMDVKRLVSTFVDGIAVSMWNFDLDQLNSNLKGMVMLPNINGIRVLDNSSKPITKAGVGIEDDMVISESKNEKLDVSIVKLNKNWKESFKNSGKGVPDSSQNIDLKEFSSEFYKISFPIKTIQDGQELNAGQGVVYFDRSYVFNRVKHGFSLILINAVIKTIALWIIFLLSTNFFVTDPLKKITTIIKNIDPKHPSGKLEDNPNLIKLASRQDELGLLANIFRKLVHAIVDNLNTIKSFSEGLEKKVEERTNELAVKTKDIQNMLQNMKQGIFTVEGNLKIHHEYSQYLESILETDKIRNESAIDLLFRNSNVSNNDIDQARNALFSVMGENEDVLELNGHLLIDEYELNVGEKTKVLRLDWQPILDADRNIEKVMVIVRDITLERELEQDAKENQKRLKIISEILQNSTNKFVKFYQNSKLSLANAKELLVNEKNDGEQLNQKLFRILHTIKGESRTFQYSLLTEAVHESEQYHSDILTQSNDVEEDVVTDNLAKIEDKLENYYNIYLNTIKKNSQTEAFQPEKLEDCYLAANQLLGTNEFKEKNSPEVVSLVSSLVNMSCFYFENILEAQIAGLNNVAEKIGKHVPLVEVEDEEKTALPYLLRRPLEEVTVHLLRNSVDHGIETPEERMKAGKSSVPKISFKVEATDEVLKIHCWDDGRGLSLEKLEKIGREKGVIDDSVALDDTKIASTIFVSGVSSQKNISDISGRGVGMDIVRKTLLDLGGDIQICFTGERAENGYRPFKFVLSVPRTASALASAA